VQLLRLTIAKHVKLRKTYYVVILGIIVYYFLTLVT